MAKPKVVTDAEVAPEGAAPAPPTLREAAQASTDAAAERLESLAAIANGETTPAPAPAKTPEQEYDEWFDSLPQDKRTRFEQNVISRHAERLAQHYGPEISNVLAMVDQDPKLKKALSRMTDEKARQWVLDTAFPIYDDERFGAPAGGDGTPAPNPQIDELTSTVHALKAKDEAREREAALNALQTERVALENTFPELKWTDPKSKEYKRVLAVVEETIDRRAKGNPAASMADVYNEYKDMWDFQAANPPPRPAPATSSREVPNPQAPRTKFEARAAINAQLEKHGSLSQLASALKR